MADTPVRVKVVYSPGPREMLQVDIDLPPGSTVVDAVRASQLLSHLPQDRTDGLKLGVWGRKAPSGQLLRDQDRVEIYRLLLVDPKVARRERFSKQGSKGAGLFASRRPGAKAGY